MTLSLAIAGASGRMGQALIRAASGKDGVRIVGATERADSAALGADVGVVAQIGALGCAVSAGVEDATRAADVWIDFTTPHSTIAALSGLSGSVRAAIIGTTGLSASDEAAIANAARRIAIVRSGNFSLGVNLLAALVRKAAAALGPEWDIEILEAHHQRKVDAPSGTALLLGRAAAEGRAEDLAKITLAPRDGITGPRPSGGIGFAVRRGGGIIGEHEVMFASEREILRLSHEALDRSLFADGALAAALWAQGKPPGLYSMSDVLGL